MVDIVGALRLVAIRVLLAGRAVPRVIVMDSERASAKHRDVISLARVDLAIEAGRETIGLGQPVDIGRARIADDLVEAPIFLHDHEDVRVLPRILAFAAGCERRQRQKRKCGNQAFYAAHRGLLVSRARRARRSAYTAPGCGGSIRARSRIRAGTSSCRSASRGSGPEDNRPRS